MKKMLTSLAGALLLLTGCEAAIGEGGAIALLHEQSTEVVDAPVAGPSYITLDGTPVPEGTNLQVAEAKRTSPPKAVPPLSRPTPTAIPPDGPEYHQQLQEFKRAMLSKSPGRLLGLPTTFSSGYPVYPATCVFYAEHVECETHTGEIVDEDYLVTHTTVIRNVDVIEGGLTCGRICVDNDGRVLGYVSKEMVAWRDRNCTWIEYGNAKCK